ncbi:MAG: transglycosylase SLT domain-containing protein [Deltaproteobacteria bacterium]|nr:transglycosylase SLT domain-containing protein [Deltaproteobacteria bacterium]
MGSEKKGKSASEEDIQKIKENGTLRKLYETHYAYVEIFDYADLKRYHRRIKTRLPKYEKIIRQAALKYGFDWRLIAAVIYQESHFDPGARSFTGVKGTGNGQGDGDQGS